MKSSFPYSARLNRYGKECDHMHISLNITEYMIDYKNELLVCYTVKLLYC